jgi:hypothetical protein
MTAVWLAAMHNTFICTRQCSAAKVMAADVCAGFDMFNNGVTYLKASFHAECANTAPMPCNTVHTCTAQ